MPRPGISRLRLGIDVGGTNTDAVLMDENVVIAWQKTPTGRNIAKAIVTATNGLIQKSGISPEQVFAVMLGTTQFTNAIIERRHLNSVAVIRLATPATSGILPMSDWPEDLKAAVGEHIYLANGGLEYDGRPISKLNEAELCAIARRISDLEIDAIAITSVFSPLDGDMENRAEAIFRRELPNIPITLSHQIGRIGLLERENAAILNATLSSLARRMLKNFSNAINDLHLSAPLFISQNDGTLMTAEFATRYPVLTFASGPTNSMRGAAMLSGIRDALVIDIGGTTTDIGLLLDGFPRDATITVDIGGVRTNFRMPDLLALGLGGGSLVTDNGLTIGPKSVGSDLEAKALVFGGDTLTLSDIAVANGKMLLGDKAKVINLDCAKAAMIQASSMIKNALEQIRPSATELPIIVVGGGALLMDDDLLGYEQIIRPSYGSVANAIGASIAMVGGECDRIFSLDTRSREEVISTATEEAKDQAVKAGADINSIRIVEIDEIPLSYMPGKTTRVRAKVVGNLSNAEIVAKK